MLNKEQIALCREAERRAKHNKSCVEEELLLLMTRGLGFMDAETRNREWRISAEWAASVAREREKAL